MKWQVTGGNRERDFFVTLRLQVVACISAYFIEIKIWTDSYTAMKPEIYVSEVEIVISVPRSLYFGGCS